MRKLHRRPERFKGASVGLDLHKDFIQYSVIDQVGDELVNASIKAEPAALHQLLGDLNTTYPAVQVTLEASGCFLWCFDLLADTLGRERVHVAAPARISAIANSQEKNDANDAWWLAYLTFEGRLPEAFVVEGALRELRIAVRERRSVVDVRSDLKRRLSSHLRQLGLSIPRHDWSSKVGHERIAERVKSVADQGMRGRAIAELQRRILAADEEVDDWDQQVAELSKPFPEIQMIVDHLPGVGLQLAAVVIAELGSPQRYHSAKAYAKATGLTPGYRESGGRRQAKSITREGSAHVRWALTQAVHACLSPRSRRGEPVRRWVEQQSKRKPKKSAMTAAARKLAQGIWYLFNTGETFDIHRVFPSSRHRTPRRRRSPQPVA